jgi:peptide/nickel transport system permease protein
VPIDEIDFKAKLRAPRAPTRWAPTTWARTCLARMLYGGRISLAVGITAMLIALTIGVSVGAAAGHFGGAMDHTLMRITDLFISLPQLPLLLLIVYLFRESLKKMLGAEAGIFILIVAVIGDCAGCRWRGWCGPSSLAAREGVRGGGPQPGCAAVPAGGRHILPNALGPVIVAGTIDVAAAIIIESSLSFLGLGFPPDIPTWGRILYDAKDNLDFAPHWAIFPGTAIFLTVLSINYIGDGLRDALDPRKVLGAK